MADPPQSHAQWPAILGACAATLGVCLVLVGGAATMVLSPINAALADRQAGIADINLKMAPLLTLNTQQDANLRAAKAQHEADAEQIKTLQAEIDKKLDANVYDLFARTIGERITAAEKTISDASTETLHQVHDLENKIVSREENTVHWAATDALTLRVNELSKTCK